jgi:putative Mg2+ transporter-C (MgtC) family protein
MSPEIHWQQIALRLTLTVIAGGLLGIERSKSGHAAGLRTTLLVTLASAVAMIQMNLLLATNGKPQDSYAVMDVMRLPLGILTGVGFIGAGAIVRKSELILGITTAATIWFSTVVGLCLGGGQLILGSVSALLGYIILWGLRWFESRIERFQMAELRIGLAADCLTAQELGQRLEAAKLRVKSFSVTHLVSMNRKKFDLEVRWPSAHGTAAIPPLLEELEQLPGLLELEWKAISDAPS